jgi:hypothetical protein
MSLFERCAGVCRQRILEFLSLRECSELLQVSRQCHADARTVLLHAWVYGPPLVQAYCTGSGNFAPYLLTLRRVTTTGIKTQSTDITSKYSVMQGELVGRHKRNFSLAASENFAHVPLWIRIQHHPAWCGVSALQNPYTNPRVICTSNVRTPRACVHSALADNDKHKNYYLCHSNGMSVRWKFSLVAAKAPRTSVSLQLKLASFASERVQLRTTWPLIACMRTMLLAQDVSNGQHICGSTSDKTEPCFTLATCHFARLMMGVAFIGVSRVDSIKALCPVLTYLMEVQRNVPHVWSESDVLPFAHAVASNISMYRTRCKAATTNPLTSFSEWAIRILKESRAHKRIVFLRDMCAPYMRATYIRERLEVADVPYTSIDALLSLKQTIGFCASSASAAGDGHLDINSLMTRGCYKDDSDHEDTDDDDDDDDDEDEDESDEDNADDEIGDHTQDTPNASSANTTEQKLELSSQQVEHARCDRFVCQLLALHKASSSWDLQALAYMSQRERWSDREKAQVQVTRVIRKLKTSSSHA